MRCAVNGETDTLRAHVRRGGLIAYPTESCYGLGCDPRNPRALKRLIQQKGRSTTKGMLLIADDFKRLKPFVRPLNGSDRARMARSWPGPVTWVVPASAVCPPELPGGRPTIAVRVTAHQGAARLCRSLGMALVSTSANKSGRKPAKTAAECRRIFGTRVRVVAGLSGRRRRPAARSGRAAGTRRRP